MSTKSDKIKKYIRIQEDCINAGIEVPKDVHMFLLSKELFPPDHIIKDIREETERLMRGKLIDINVNDLIVKVRIYWEEDNYANFDVDGWEKSGKTRLEKFLLSIVDDSVMHDYIRDGIDIYKNKEYVAFNKEIRDICEKANKLAEKYSKFDFDRDILGPVEETL